MSDREREGLFELTASFVGSATRMGLMVASAPLVVLPTASRRRVRRAMAEVARAIVSVPREMTVVSERVVDEMFTGAAETPALPSADRMGERARAFTERLSRAAEEFGASVSRASSRAADEVERQAAKVDEWVEKK